MASHEVVQNEFRKVIEDKSNLIEEKWHEHFNI